MVSNDNLPKVTGKRKREISKTYSIQVVTGSYERILHGFTVSIPTENGSEASFSDNFLFNAHASSIRCLALSPPSSSSRVLATGGSDEQINLYQLPTTAPSEIGTENPTVSHDISQRAHGKPLNSSRHRELGSLTYHNATITSLCFPSRSKLLSSSLDDTIAVTRTRDWTVFARLKAPKHKPDGRPSGYTGDDCLGINDLAIHPSRRLAISVRQGERCMRLWNLVTGMKAGVLDFDISALALLNYGKKELGWREGEGRQITWSNDGQEFAVAFENGVLFFGLDCTLRGYLAMTDRKKVGQIAYLPNLKYEGSTRTEVEHEIEGAGKDTLNIFTLSTEDGRIQFYDTRCFKKRFHEVNQGSKELTQCHILGELNFPKHQSRSRIKDFAIVPMAETNDAVIIFYYILAACSDGRVHLARLDNSEFRHNTSTHRLCDCDSHASKGIGSTTGTTVTPREIGKILGVYETGHRVTCLVAFLMQNDFGSS